MIISEGGETMRKVKKVLYVLGIFAMIGGVMLIPNKTFMYGFNSNKQPEIAIVDTKTYLDDVALDFGNGKQPEIIELSQHNQTDDTNIHPSNVSHDEQV